MSGRARVGVHGSFGLLVLALSVVACDPGSSLGVVNNSDQQALVRITWPDSTADMPLGQTWLIEPHTDGVLVERSIGFYNAKIDVLRKDCSVVASWQSRNGGTVTIAPDGSVTVADAGPGAGASPVIPNVTACGFRAANGS